jgi:hypothetical protein
MQFDNQTKWKILFILAWMAVPFCIVGLAIVFKALITLIGMGPAFLIAISLMMGVVAGIMVFSGDGN